MRIGLRAERVDAANAGGRKTDERRLVYPAVPPRTSTRAKVRFEPNPEVPNFRCARSQLDGPLHCRKLPAARQKEMRTFKYNASMFRWAMPEVRDLRDTRAVADYDVFQIPSQLLGCPRR